MNHFSERQFTPMHKILKPATHGNFVIDYRTSTAQGAKHMRLMSLMSGSYEYATFKEGTYTRLIDRAKNEIVMSDTPMEQDTNRGFLWRANGDVLIGGLGMGMLLHPLQLAPEVRTITVIEKHPEILELVKKSGFKFKKKTRVIIDDIFTWVPDKYDVFDCIWFDIWNSIGGENYADMKKLHRRFARKLNRPYECYMESWRRDKCRKDDLSWRKYEREQDARKKMSLAVHMLAGGMA